MGLELWLTIGVLRLTSTAWEFPYIEGSYVGLLAEAILAFGSISRASCFWKLGQVAHEDLRSQGY